MSPEEEKQNKTEEYGDFQNRQKDKWCENGHELWKSKYSNANASIMPLGKVWARLEKVIVSSGVLWIGLIVWLRVMETAWGSLELELAEVTGSNGTDIHM